MAGQGSVGSEAEGSGLRGTGNHSPPGISLLNPNGEKKYILAPSKHPAQASAESQQEALGVIAA